MADVTNDKLKEREQQTQGTINSAYDAGLNAQKQGLLDAYNQNTAAQTQQGQNIQQSYDTAANDVGVQNARNERNLTQFAAARDVNTGLGSQHQLNLGNARAAATGAVDFARQQALQENERQKVLMSTNYQNQVSAALADNDYKRAAALLDDYNNQNTWREQQAEILASFGDFSGYNPLYGQEAANGMQNIWNAQNPEIAYRLGRIDGETYKLITGQYPAGYTPGGGGWYGGSGGWGRGGGGGGGGDDEPTEKHVDLAVGEKRGPSGHSRSSHSSTGGSGKLGVPFVKGATTAATNALLGVIK